MSGLVAHFPRLCGLPEQSGHYVHTPSAGSRALHGLGVWKVLLDKKYQVETSFPLNTKYKAVKRSVLCSLVGSWVMTLALLKKEELPMP